MADNETIKLIFQAVDNQTATIKKINTQLDSYSSKTKTADNSNKKTTESFGKMGKAIGGAVAAFLTYKSAIAIKETAELAAKAELVNKNFENFATTAGLSTTKMMGDLRSATLGMVSDLELQQSAMKGMISGVSFEDMTIAMEYVTKYASSTGDNVAAKMQTVMTGLARGSAQFMDDVGIQVMGAKDVVGATIDQMKEKMGNFVTSEKDASVQAAQLKADIANLTVEIGNALLPAFVAVLPYVKSFAMTIKQAAEGLSALVQGTAKNNEIKAEQISLLYDEIEASKKIVIEYEKLQKAIDSGGKGMESLFGSDLTKADYDTAVEKIKLYTIELDRLQKATTGGKKKASGVTSTGPSMSDGEIAEAARIAEARAKAGWVYTDSVMNQYTVLNEWRDKSVADAKKSFEDEQKFKYDMGKKAADELFTMMEEDEQKRFEFLQKASEKEEQLNQEKMDKKREHAQMSIDLVSSFSNAANSIYGAITNRRMSEMDAEMSAEKDKLKNSRMSAKQKAKEMEKLDKEGAKRRYEMQLGEWKTSLIMAGVNTALGVTKALTTMGPPASFIMAGLTAAAGIAAAVTIATKKPKPPFKQGGFVQGQSYSGDNVDVRVNSAEAILNPSQQKNFMDIANGKPLGGSTSQSTTISPVFNIGSVTRDTLDATKEMMNNATETIKQTLYDMVTRKNYDKSLISLEPV